MELEQELEMIQIRKMEFDYLSVFFFRWGSLGHSKNGLD